MTALTRITCFPIRLYQWFISPWLGHNCRFHPSCSHYAIEAIETHGIKGLWLTMKRLLRCQPFGGFGEDPVPVTFLLPLEGGGRVGVKPLNEGDPLLNPPPSRGRKYIGNNP